MDEYKVMVWLENYTTYSKYFDNLVDAEACAHEVAYFPGVVQALLCGWEIYEVFSRGN